MNLLLEVIIANGLLFDAFGVIGLGLLALAALRLVREKKSWGGSMMAYGAVALLIARIYVLLALRKKITSTKMQILAHFFS